MAIVGSGLGVLQSNLNFVNDSGTFWDSTNWDMFPRPFLDSHALAYANAIAAWTRGEKAPEWIQDLLSGTKRSMRNSLKYLIRTNDSFFQLSSGTRKMLDWSQNDWMNSANADSISTQIVAIRQLEFDGQTNSRQESLLQEKLRSGTPAIQLHSISATDRMAVGNESIAEELGLLTQHTDDEIRSKAMLALARLRKMDELSIDTAAKMIDSNRNYVVFAGVFALSTLESVPEHIMPAANRGFIRALKTVNDEFIGLYATAFDRWLDDPQAHLEFLLKEDSPEFLEIGLEALQNVGEKLVSLE